MKNLLIAIILPILLIWSEFTSAKECPTIQSQLEEINIFWKNKNFPDPILKEKILLRDEVALIRMHLSLVEQKLRAVTQKNITPQQGQNRNKCLDILNTYWKAGIFPRNIYHSSRTPYFIDDLRNACAVGQLIIETGYSDFALKVSLENNNKYILDLNRMYPELQRWADKFGFTLEELAWIQPGYGCVNSECPNDSLRDVTCFGGNDGCFGAFHSTTLSNPPYIHSWYMYHASTNIWKEISKPCDLNAGMYKVVVTNSIGISQEFNYLIKEPEILSSGISSSSDDGTCNGTASSFVTGGTPPYSYHWSPSGQTTQTAINLCQGLHIVIITDAHGCTKTDTVQVNVMTSSDEVIDDNSIKLYPNPTTNKFNILTSLEKINHTSLEIKDIYGQTMYLLQGDKERPLPQEIDISYFSSGVYFVDLIFNGKRNMMKIVKK